MACSASWTGNEGQFIFSGIVVVQLKIRSHRRIDNAINMGVIISIGRQYERSIYLSHEARNSLGFN